MAHHNNFGSRVTEELRRAGVEHRRVLPYNSPANGKCEVTNRILKRLMAKGLSLEQAVRAHSELPTTTGLVPMEAFLGRRPAGARSWLTQLVGEDRRRSLEEMLQQARARYEDHPAPGRGDAFPVLQVNQVVYARRHEALGADQYAGPFLVLDASPAEHVVARNLRTGHQARLHRARLKPGRVQTEDLAPRAVEEDGGQLWAVERIVGHREQRENGITRVQYRVRWAGYGDDQDSYVYPEDVSEACVLAYLRQLKRRR